MIRVFQATIVLFSIFILTGLSYSDQDSLNKELLEAIKKKGNETVLSSDVSAIESALKRGANPNAVKINGEIWTPLILATYYCRSSNFPEVVKLLIAYGADVNRRSYDLIWTPLHMAVISAKNIEAIKLLLLAGADPNVKGGHNSEKPLEWLYDYKKFKEDQLNREGKEYVTKAIQLLESYSSGKVKKQRKKYNLCEHVYIGKVFEGKSAMFGIKQTYEVVGFSPKTGKATITQPHDRNFRQEVNCYDIPE